MKPASAMSFALKKPGRSSAIAGMEFAAVAVTAAKAAERRRSRFVSMWAFLLHGVEQARGRHLRNRSRKVTRARRERLCKIGNPRGLAGQSRFSGAGGGHHI